MVLEMEMSKTYQYRKVMKPMLERKRRARINKCLDELKDIMVECLTQEGEHITRLEKADILELTVEHMKKLKQQKRLRLNSHHDYHKASVADSFKSGYVYAANEVSKALATVPGVSVDLGTQLMSHLGHRLNHIQVVVPTATPTSPPPSTMAGIPIVKSMFIPAQGSQISQFSTNSFFEDNSSSSNISSAASNCSLPIIVSSPSPSSPPSECCSDRSTSPTPSEGSSVWRPWRNF